jgi:hypothetical protein
MRSARLQNRTDIGDDIERADDRQGGPPLNIYQIDLSDLKRFTGSELPLHDTGIRLFHGAKEPVHGLKSIATATNSQRKFILTIQALKVTFVAVKSSNAITVLPIVNDDRFGFHAGKEISLVSALAAMQPVAISITA